MSETPTNSFPLLGRISPTSNDRARIQRLTEEAEDGKRPIGDARRDMRATAGFCGLALSEQFLYRWEGKELVFWEQPAETPTTPACWCRNCDKAAKAGLSPLAAMRLGTRFIVCPDCGNKRCPRGTNHELACTNSNQPGQKGSEWEHALGFTALPAPNETSPEYQSLPDGTYSVDTGVGRTVFAAPADQAPELLSGERLARVHQIRQMVEDFSEDTPGRPTLARAFADLFAERSWLMLETARLEAHTAAQAEQIRLLETELDYQRSFNFRVAIELAAAEARAAEAEAQVAMLRVELDEAGRELSYERQLRQQTEEAMITLAADNAALRERNAMLGGALDAEQQSVNDLVKALKAIEARAAEAEAQVAMLRVELAEQEGEKLALVNEITARDKGENTAIWQLTRMITDTFQDYGKKWGGPAVKNDKRFWAGIEDDWYDEIKTALWPTRDND